MSDTRRTPKRPVFVEAEQFEMSIDGGFTLIQETTIDADRIVREARESEERKQAADSAQMHLFPI